jgi:hypothetical protein
LLRLLGHFPLAVAQAGRSISLQKHLLSQSSKDPLREALEWYTDEFRVNARKLLSKKPPPVAWDYRNDSVFTTWEISYNSIAQRTPDAARLLLLSGFFNRHDVFEEMLGFAGASYLNGDSIRMRVLLRR